jgi:cohesin loading factor subunit SCC2
VKRLYKLLQSNRQRRDAFIESVFSKLNKFVDGSDNSAEDEGFHIFLMEQLAFLPYTFRDEVLLVVYKASELLSLHGDAKLQQLRQLAKPEDYQVLENADALPNTVCLRQVGVLSMLILLKAHIKNAHALSDAACEKFAPSSREKEKDTLLTVWTDERQPELDLTSLRPFLVSEVDQETVGTLYRLAKDLSEQDLNSDFTQEKKKPRKRKAVSTPTPDSTAKKVKSEKTKRKTTKKRRSFALTDEEDAVNYDDDGDSDW